MKRLILYLTILCAFACTSGQKDLRQDLVTKSDSINLIRRIQAQSRLYTAEYHIHKIITHNDLIHLHGSILGYTYDHKFNIGKRKIAIPLDATVKAYIDFSTFSEKNIEQTEEYIHITLPDPKFIITSSKVDNKGIRQYTTRWRSEFSDEEITSFTKQGLESIIENVPDMGIINTSRENAAQTLIHLLTGVANGKQIIITYRDNLEEQTPKVIYGEGDSMILNYEP